MKQYRLLPSTTHSEDVSKFKIDYAGRLNKQQFEVVTALEGPVLCIAGAGSGKTSALVYRVARMVESGILPRHILLLTFTRKAAVQMLNRASALISEGSLNVPAKDGQYPKIAMDGELFEGVSTQKMGGLEKASDGPSFSGITGGTYHSFANRVLREFGASLNLPLSFSILDETDACDTINLIRNDCGFSKLESRFPMKKTLKKILSKSVNCDRSLEDVVEKDYAHFSEYQTEIQKVLDMYSEYKLKNRLFDYDDLMIYLRKLLEEVPEALNKLAGRYRYIMVDEYQDTNKIQSRISILLGGIHHNLMVVGDDAQSIYSFRGAYFKNLQDFVKSFPNCRVIRLEENYRSTQAILNASNSLISHAKENFSKTLFTSRTGGEKPALVACKDEDEQSRFVTQRILELREEGVRLDQIAVLFRSGFHAYQLELELKKKNIPFEKWGGFKFLEASHIKDMLAHIRVLANPFELLSWQRVLLLVEGVGIKSVPIIFEAIKAAKNPYDLASLLIPRRSAKSGLEKLGGVLLKGAECIGDDPQTVYSIFSDYYLPLLKNHFDDFPKRIRDIDQLAIIASKYPSIEAFLGDLALEPPNKSVEQVLAGEADNEERLVLSTIHSAKGLEWHSVFIIHAVEGRFPSFLVLNNNYDLEEERRLLYVAMTRAKENLYLTYPIYFLDQSSNSFFTRPSRFIEEIAPDLFERWQLASQ